MRWFALVYSLHDNGTISEGALSRASSTCQNFEVVINSLNICKIVTCLMDICKIVTCQNGYL